MKYIVMSAIALSFLVTSCSKEEINIVEESIVALDVVKVPSGDRVWFDKTEGGPGEDGVDYGCKGSGGGCLPDIVVQAITINPGVVRELLNTIERGNTVAIKNIFKRQKKELSEIIPFALIDGVIREELQVVNKGNFRRNKKVYLKFIGRKGNIKSIIPLRN